MNIKKLNGMQLLILRVSKPNMAKAVNAELARRAGHNPNVALAVAA